MYAYNTMSGHYPSASDTLTVSVQTHPTGSPVGAFFNIGTYSTPPADYPVTGWAVDYSTTSPISVQIATDYFVSTISANQYVPGSAASGNYLGYGDNHNYSFSVPRSPQPGIHTICVYALGVGADGNTNIGCQSYEVTRHATAPTWSGNPTATAATVTANFTDNTDGESGYQLQRSVTGTSGAWQTVATGPAVASVGGTVTLSDPFPVWSSSSCYRAVVNMPDGTSAVSTSDCVTVPYPSPPSVELLLGPNNSMYVDVTGMGAPSVAVIQSTIPWSDYRVNGGWDDYTFSNLTPGVTYTITFAGQYAAPADGLDMVQTTPQRSTPAGRAPRHRWSSSPTSSGTPSPPQPPCCRTPGSPWDKASSLPIPITPS